jgi:hypothetical protein
VAADAEELWMGRWAGIGLGVVAGLVYLVLGPDKTNHDSHLPIARAFLEGRLHLVEPMPWLELVPRDGGGWFSPFPPLLSVLLLPAAALGVALDTNHLAAFFGGLSVALAWELLWRIEVERWARLALTLAWAFGSQLLWVAGEGGQHLAPQAAAAALLLAALVLAVDGQRPFLAGLLLAAGAAARLPVGLALPLVLYLYRPGAAGRGGRGDGALVRFLGPEWPRLLAGVAIPLALMALYNLARFGSPWEFGYGLIRNIHGESVLDEPWYHDGIVSLRYLPLGLHTMLLRGLEFRDAAPWVYGSLAGTSVLLTMPILWWVFGARGRLAAVIGLAVVLVMIPNLLHGNPGFAQIGYRFVLDAQPLLWLMLGLALRDGLHRPATVALGAGVLANGWLSGVQWLELV